MNYLKTTVFMLLIIFGVNSAFAVNDNVLLSEKFPRTLSEYGFFEDAKAQQPSEGVLPYELISTLFSDYSKKQRWVYVPEGSHATYQRDWVFNFPVGSALIKTFYYPLDERDSDKGMNMMETRVLLRKDSGWEAVSYAWNENQTEANIKIAGKTINTSWIDEFGDIQQVRYRVPNKNQCKECHAANDQITPIGPKARNLNSIYPFIDGSKNQLTKWIDEEFIKEYPSDLLKTTDWKNVTASLDERARSYLDINCGHCHSPTGAANSTGLYLNLSETRKKHLGIYKKPVATGRGSGNLQYSIVPGKPEESIMLLRMLSTDPGVMMPESGRALTHTEAVELIKDWISSL